MRSYASWCAVLLILPTCSTVSPRPDPQPIQRCVPSPPPSFPPIYTVSGEPCPPGYLCYRREDGTELALWASAAVEWMDVAWAACGPAVEP
jgi:hypothetical protein